MSLIKWEPFGDIDHFFEDFPSFSKMDRDLAVDVYEDGTNVVAQMNLPGVDPDKVDVSVEDNYLHISGSREEEKEEKKKHYYSKEIRRGSFERVVNLPAVVEKDKVTAEYKNGQLKVTMPKVTKTEAGKVKVEVKK